MFCAVSFALVMMRTVINNNHHHDQIETDKTVETRRFCYLGFPTLAMIRKVNELVIKTIQSLWWWRQSSQKSSWWSQLWWSSYLSWLIRYHLVYLVIPTSSPGPSWWSWSKCTSSLLVLIQETNPSSMDEHYDIDAMFAISNFSVIAVEKLNRFVYC